MQISNPPSRTLVKDDKSTLICRRIEHIKTNASKYRCRRITLALWLILITLNPRERRLLRQMGTKMSQILMPTPLRIQRLLQNPLNSFLERDICMKTNRRMYYLRFQSFPLFVISNCTLRIKHPFDQNIGFRIPSVIKSDSKAERNPMDCQLDR